MAQRVKFLPCRYKDMSSDPQPSQKTKQPGTVYLHVIPAWGQR